MPGFSIEQSPIGRIVVAPEVPEGHRLFYTTRDYDGAINDELEALAGKPIAHCKQVHGCGVRRPRRRSDAESGGTAAALQTCDALWSTEPNALAIKVADCLPISLIGKQLIANIHCGWRGAVQRIIDVTLDHVAVPDAAWLGPSIRVCCFEVGEEVASQFDEQFVDRSRAKPHVDIAAFAAARLRARGVKRVHDSGLCTRCDGSIFHSFRREGRGGGRNLAVLTMD